MRGGNESAGADGEMDMGTSARGAAPAPVRRRKAADGDIVRPGIHLQDISITHTKAAFSCGGMHRPLAQRARFHIRLSRSVHEQPSGARSADGGSQVDSWTIQSAASPSSHLSSAACVASARVSCPDAVPSTKLSCGWPLA